MNFIHSYYIYSFSAQVLLACTGLARSPRPSTIADTVAALGNPVVHGSHHAHLPTQRTKGEVTIVNK